MAALVLTGCAAVLGETAPSPSAASTGTPSPEPAPSPTEGPTPDATSVRTRGLAVTAGDRTVLHALATAPGAVVTTVPDGDQAVLTIDPGDPTAPVSALLAVPDGATVEVQDDDSVVVRAADSSFLGGAAPPSGAPGAGAGAPRVTVAGDGLIALTGVGPVTVRVGSVALLGTDWGDREGGRSLAVEPSGWARSAGLAGEVAVWAELVAAEPDADTPVMHDQLVCHTVGAPDKPTWNLEPWRPDVGLLEVMLAGCNPT
ncbi:DUF2599 domain-containing protein [uncultured Cellulomonas sp.]|uniref:DUF2599 domain-containing protein n=1 Tax=uncultured Cellulomonas sp. TaxID=189682 RepID=UPI00261C8E9C|nr:DUF2599 domain-containing protein [uncultured Cellulomonas sp.]